MISLTLKMSIERTDTYGSMDIVNDLRTLTEQLQQLGYVIEIQEVNPEFIREELQCTLADLSRTPLDHQELDSLPSSSKCQDLSLQNSTPIESSQEIQHPHELYQSPDN